MFFRIFFYYALHCGNKKLSRFSVRNSAEADAIIHGDSLGKNVILRSGLRNRSYTFVVNYILLNVKKLQR